MTRGDDHVMHDFDISITQINVVGDNRVNDSQGCYMSVHMESEEEDDDDNEKAEYVEKSDFYNDADDIGEGDGDLDASIFIFTSLHYFIMTLKFCRPYCTSTNETARDNFHMI